MQNFFDSLLNKFDLWIVLIVLCSGFFQGMYLKVITLAKDVKYDSALKTLLVSALVSTMYIFLLKDPEKANNWAKYFVSYFAATSLFELLIGPFVKYIKTKTGQPTD